MSVTLLSAPQELSPLSAGAIADYQNPRLYLSLRKEARAIQSRDDLGSGRPIRPARMMVFTIDTS